MRWTCRDCGSAWAPGAPCCPACRSESHTEEAAPVAAPAVQLADAVAADVPVTAEPAVAAGGASGPRPAPVRWPGEVPPAA